MAELTSEIADLVVAACRDNSDEIIEALSRALDAQIALSVGEPETLDPENLPEDLSAAGLSLALVVGETRAVVLLPESSGLLPDWCADPDPTSQSKLATLAQELGMLVLPDDFPADDFQAEHVTNLAERLQCVEPGLALAVVPLELSDDDKQGVARLIWPVGPAVEVTESPAAESEPKAEAAPPPGKASPGLSDLPAYSRSLLRVKVPVVVTLAEKRQPLERILELGPGSIIQFDKSCEEMLDMDVGGQPLATGEAVKVGDKFGLRVSSIILPEERFISAKPGKN